ncbi:hypothetical protein P879_03501 [Paragonimus westermani]|uniref:Uncharacterized protein n=1 Tax=Paragonimus westermani TaxID=34504 RepID=A0A8T0DJI0_9TREM|nr:hypothetical protein P879_03501 [Paragonimus westermani]
MEENESSKPTSVDSGIGLASNQNGELNDFGHNSESAMGTGEPMELKGTDSGTLVQSVEEDVDKCPSLKRKTCCLLDGGSPCAQISSCPVLALDITDTSLSCYIPSDEGVQKFYNSSVLNSMGSSISASSSPSSSVSVYVKLSKSAYVIKLTLNSRELKPVLVIETVLVTKTPGLMDGQQV